MAQGLRSPPLIGREAVIEVIGRCLDDVLDHRGAVLLLDGEAGVGKSRLLRAAVDRAQTLGLVVLSGTAVEGGGAYRPVSEALLSHLRDAEVADAAELRPFRSALARIAPGWDGTDQVPFGVDPLVVLGEGVLRLLRRLGAGSGCVLVLDDLHWADEDTIALVEYLAGAVQSSSVLVVGATRTDEPLTGRLHRLRRHAGLTMIAVERLDGADIERVASACLGGAAVPEVVARFLVEHADGLPLLAEELLVGLVESGVLVPAPHGWDVTRRPTATVPPTLAGLVAERLAGLDRHECRVVEAAAVIGREVDWTLLEPATGLDEEHVLEALRAARDRHLLVSDGASSRLRWPHALTRDAVLAQTTAADQAVVARRVAGVLEARGVGDESGLAADLYERSGDLRRAARLVWAAAERAVTVGALRTADEQMARVMVLDPELNSVVADRVRVLTLAGRSAEAMAVGDPALTAMRGDGHAELSLLLARAALADGRWGQAGRYVERAGRPDEAAAVAIAADAAFGAGDPVRAASLAARAIAMAERDDRPDELCAALEVLGRCHRESDPDVAAGVFARAAQVAAEHALGPARISALIGLGTVELLVADAPARLLESRDMAMDAGMLRQACSIDVLLADRALLVDGPAAGSALAAQTAELAGDLQLTGLQAMAELLSAFGPAVAGDRREATVRIDRAVSRPHAPVEVAALRSWMMAFGPLATGDLEQTLSLLDEGVAQLARHQATAPLPQWGLWALLRTVLGRDDQQARDQLRRAPAALRSANRGALLYADAVATGRAGRHDAAAQLFAEGDRVLASEHWWRRLLHLATCRAAIADGWGDPVTTLRADLTAFEAGGEERLARTCRDHLRRAGVTVRRGRGSTAVPPWLRAMGVTSREMDVLTLVADRLSNAQIVDRLYLSARTVETHVANLLTKTGTSSRGQLVRLVAEGSADASPAR